MKGLPDWIKPAVSGVFVAAIILAFSPPTTSEMLGTPAANKNKYKKKLS